MRRAAAIALALALLPAALASAAVPGHGRGWELVTAGDTGGVSLFGAQAWAPHGDGVAWLTIGPTPGAPSGELLFFNRSVRTPSGWRIEPVGAPFTAPELQFVGTAGQAVSSDLGTWLWASVNPLLPGAPSAPETGLYRRDVGGTLTLYGTLGEIGSAEATLQAASDDVEHAAFQTFAHLLPADAGRIAGRGAYELSAAGLRLAAVDGSGQALSACGSVWGNGAKGGGALSGDGATGFVTSPDPSTTQCGPASVYMLKEGAAPVRISESRCTRPDCNAQMPVRFAGAVADGSSAYLLTGQQLTDDDTDTTVDLYRYDAAAGELTRVSAGAAAARVEAARVPNLGRRSYFVARGALIPGQGTDGALNLYVNDVGGTRFLAILASVANLEGAALSADGDALDFSTTAALLPGDADGSADVYRYDADDGSLLALSAGGAEPAAPAMIPTIAEPFLPAQNPNPVSADGERALFLTANPLLPEDVNAVADVYEWASGTLGLVTPGAGPAASFSGASADGSSVYFQTSASLVPGDDDGGEEDIYAARLGGGFPPSPGEPGCEGEACRGPAPGRLGREVPPTAVGVGEPLPRAHRRGGLVIAPLGARARRRLERSGKARVTVRVPGPGQVSLVAFAFLGGFEEAVSRSGAPVFRGGAVRLPLRLSEEARLGLRRNGSLRLRIVVRHSHLRVPARRDLELRSLG